MARLYVLVYSFAMKYVWIAVAMVILVRIDLIMHYIDKSFAKLQSSAPPINLEDLPANKEHVSFKDDQSFHKPPRQVFLSLLEGFKSNPTMAVREKAFVTLKENPSLFTDKLDPELEARIYSWRDLLYQKNKESYYFLLELLNVLRGENQEMVKRFFSLLIDIELTDFLQVYSKSKDSNCMIITMLGDNLAEEEKNNELIERHAAIVSLLASEKIDPAYQVFTQRCELTLKIHLNKIKPTQPTSETEDMAVTEEDS
jgi:hypothetical protein